MKLLSVLVLASLSYVITANGGLVNEIQSKLTHGVNYATNDTITDLDKFISTNNIAVINMVKKMQLQ